MAHLLGKTTHKTVALANTLVQVGIELVQGQNRNFFYPLVQHQMSIVLYLHPTELHFWWGYSQQWILKLNRKSNIPKTS